MRFDPEGYQEAVRLVIHARILRRFFHEVIDAFPARDVLVGLAVDNAYRDILNEELAPYALTLLEAFAEHHDGDAKSVG